MIIIEWPNQSPEPTPVGAGPSASRSTVFGPAWKTFLLIIAGLVSLLEPASAADKATINFSPSPNITFLDDAWTGSQTIKLDFRKTPIADLFDVYRAASGLALAIDSRVPVRLPVTVQTSVGVTKCEAMDILEQALVSQAGVIITRLDEKRASVTFNDQLVVKPFKK